MSRFLVLVLVALFGVQVSGAARATTYDLTLDPTSGNIFGSGVMDVTAPGTGSGVSVISDLSITIDGANFNLKNELGAATATFVGGDLKSINYIGASIADFGLNLDFLGSQGLMYSFLDIGTDSVLSQGMINAVDPSPGGVSATPLPTTVVMFATGLLALGFLIYRRKAAPAFKIA